MLEAAPIVGGNIRSQIVAGFVCEKRTQYGLDEQPCHSRVDYRIGFSPGGL